MLLATTAAGARSSRAAYAEPTSAPTTGPIATFCGRRPSAPTAAPVTVPTTRGLARPRRSATQPSGAAMAALTAMRCHSAGISPGCCRARATASLAASPVAPTAVPTAIARRPR